MDGPDWSMRTFRIDGDNSSYFDKVNEKKIQEITKQINEQVRKEANQAIHNIVTGKDAEINELKESINRLEKEIDVLKKAPQPTGDVTNLSDLENVCNALERALKYGEVTKDNLNNERLKKIRDIIISWKEFFEEYKWKSNYISNKIKSLLKDTNDIL